MKLEVAKKEIEGETFKYKEKSKIDGSGQGSLSGGTEGLRSRGLTAHSSFGTKPTERKKKPIEPSLAFPPYKPSGIQEKGEMKMEKLIVNRNELNTGHRVSEGGKH